MLIFYLNIKLQTSWVFCSRNGFLPGDWIDMSVVALETRRGNGVSLARGSRGKVTDLRVRGKKFGTWRVDLYSKVFHHWFCLHSAPSAIPHLPTTLLPIQHNLNSSLAGMPRGTRNILVPYLYLIKNSVFSVPSTTANKDLDLYSLAGPSLWSTIDPGQALGCTEFRLREEGICEVPS